MKETTNVAKRISQQVAVGAVHPNANGCGGRATPHPTYLQVAKKDTADEEQPDGEPDPEEMDAKEADTKLPETVRSRLRREHVVRGLGQIHFFK